MVPYQGGGEMIHQVTFEKTVFNELPYKFEAGTPNMAGVAGLDEAIDFITETGIDNIRGHEHRLLDHFAGKLTEIPQVRIIGNAEEKTSVVSIEIDSIHPYDAGMVLDKLGFAVRTGHHCAQPLIDFYQLPGTLRASFGVYNTFEELDRFTEALKQVITLFE